MPSMNIRLDDHAYEGLVDFGRVHGVSAAGLVNAFGEELHALEGQRLPGWARHVLTRGREIDAGRRRRS